MPNLPEPAPGAATVTVVVCAWGAEPDIRECVESVLASEKVAADVVLVDNGADNEDVPAMADWPRVTVVRPGTNLGFTGGCDYGAQRATGQYLALLNSDAVVAPDTLARLVDEATHPDVGIAVASVRLAEDPDLVNAGANPVHVLGLSWSGGIGRPERRTAPVDTAGASGACLLTRRAHWERLGGFDPEYFAYHEDVELSLRTWRLGLRVVYVPEAIAVHRYEFGRNPNKMYYVERNRLVLVCTMWGRRAKLLLAPALLGLEVAMLARALAGGWLPAKVRGWRWIWTHRGHLRERRALLRGEQVVPDRAWMRVLTTQIDEAFAAVPGRRPVNALMAGYWRLVRRWV
jgi:GT2 family glycosyltransferase